jgi:hypothetical protein
MERELTIILTPCLSSKKITNRASGKSQIADYSGPNSEASMGIAAHRGAPKTTLCSGADAMRQSDF